MTSHWDRVARHWSRWGPPLRPAAEDIAEMERLVRDHAARPLRALLWGVTPEIATMAWPAGTSLTAVDRSREMIAHVWPGDVAGARRAVCGDWLATAAEPGAFDVVIGDGVLSVLPFPDGARALLAEAERVLAPGGLLVLRLFCAPLARETPAAVFAELHAGRIASFHAFKLRLAMAMQADVTAGVCTGDVHAAWAAAKIDPAELAAARGWSRDAIATIDSWAGAPARLAFPTVPEAERMFAPAFDPVSHFVCKAELGERCPTLALRKRSRR